MKRGVFRKMTPEKAIGIRIEVQGIKQGEKKKKKKINERPKSLY